MEITFLYGMTVFCGSALVSFLLTTDLPWWLRRRRKTPNGKRLSDAPPTQAKRADAEGVG